MTNSFRIEALGVDHDRSVFSCSIEVLDRYFREQATQDMRRRANTCYVAVENGSEKIAGYYTLAAAGVPLTDLPPPMIKKMPRYPSVPVARLGRLAVDQSFHGKKLGAALLANAIMRAARSEIAVFAIAVDAKDATAESFYIHHGFVSLGNRRLVLPLPGFNSKI